MKSLTDLSIEHIKRGRPGDEIEIVNHHSTVVTASRFSGEADCEIMTTTYTVKQDVQDGDRLCSVRVLVAVWELNKEEPRFAADYSVADGWERA